MSPFTPEPTTRWTIARPYVFIATAIVVLLGLWEVSRNNYVLFHTLAEMFAVAVSFSIFIIAFNTRRFLRNNYLMLLGMALLFVGLIDLLHALAYNGMGVFRDEDPDTATQLWLAARFLQTVSLLIAPALLTRPPIKTRHLLPVLAPVTAALIAVIFVWPVMPTAFDEGGLTTFKIVSEYLICLGLAGALVLLLMRRRFFESRVAALLAGYLVLSILAEIAFTLYSRPDGAANLVGHLIRILAIYLAYKAIVQTGLVNPYTLLFRELKLSEKRHREGEEVASRIANTLQEAILSVPDTLPGVDFSHLYQSATQATRVGGDFYDLFELDDGRIGIVMGDVSGKGLPAATLTSKVKDTLRAYCHIGDPPARALARTNHLLVHSTDTTSWVSVFLGYLDVHTGHLVYCSAGHPPPAIRRSRQGGAADGRSFFLRTTSPILAAFEEAEFADAEESLAPGDILLLYTDGVIEARRDHEFFGDARLLRTITALDSEDAEGLPAALFARLSEFTDGRLPDDVAIVALSLQSATAR